MNRTYQMLWAMAILLVLSGSVYAQNQMRHFITRSGSKLMEGDKEYRFISVNIPNLHLVEDNMAFKATNEWRFPDEFEITDALASVKELGGRAVRTYVISICRKTGPNPIPCHVKRPGEFNEDAFRALDKVLEVANRVGVRVIIPLVDNWKWWGGAEQYAEYHDKSAGAFWTDPEVIADFKKNSRLHTEPAQRHHRYALQRRQSHSRLGDGQRTRLSLRMDQTGCCLSQRHRSI